MGRSLTNAMVNLNVDSEVEEALFEVSEEDRLRAKEHIRRVGGIMLRIMSGR